MRRRHILGLAAVSALDAASALARAARPPRRARRDDAARLDADVLQLQVLLDRAHSSPGEIDGRMGSNTQRAVARFQQMRRLPAAGAPTPETWDALGRDTEALVTYQLTEADVAGPFTPVPDDMMEKAKLERLAYSSPLEAIGERFHASPDLLRRLNPEASFAQAGELLRVPNVHGEPVRSRAARIVVDADRSSLAAYDGDGAVLASYPASTGSEHDPLPVGDWKVSGVVRNPPFFYNPDLFWDADESHAKARLPPGPNSPVGVVWIDLTREHFGIHGSPEPSQVGKTQSHGCVRLTNWDAEELAGLVEKGTPAELRRAER
jgi:lipoprotein-anchoring transpeptidase ErfK/SrfK